MKTKHLIGVVVGIFVAASIGTLAQISGGGVEGGGGQPAGSAFSIQYKNGNRFGGTGPGTSGQVLTSNGVGSAPTFQAGSGSSVPTTVQGDTLFASAANTLSALTKNTSATRYLANTGTNNNPAWAQVNVANGITGTVPVANGGTNLTASADDNLMLGNGTTWETKSVPDCTDTGGNHLNYTASTNAFSCGTSGSGAGSTGSFTLTWTTACTTSPTTLVEYTLDSTGTVVTWLVNSMSATSCTSDSTAFATDAGDVPANLRPTSADITTIGVRTMDNSALDATMGCITVTTDGTAIVRRPTNGCLGGWTNTGNKAINGTAGVGTTISYRLDP